MQDLFNSTLSRAALADLYVDSYTAFHGFPPKDHVGLGRAGLVDKIEQLDQLIKNVRQPA